MVKENILFDFYIDDLTNSVRNRISRDSFPTEITRLTKADLKMVTKKIGWNFNWRVELNNERIEVYKEDWSNDILKIENIELWDT